MINLIHILNVRRLQNPIPRKLAHTSLVCCVTYRQTGTADYGETATCMTASSTSRAMRTAQRLVLNSTFGHQPPPLITMLTL